MKKISFLTAALTMTLALQPVLWTAALPVSAQTIQTKLTNKDVLDMSKAGMSEAIIIAKINSSLTSFDTSLATLQQLKSAGLSDAILLAMLQPGSKSSSDSSPAPQSAMSAPQNMGAAPTSYGEMAIPDGTEIEVQLKNNLSGEDAKMGDTVDFSVVRPIQVNGVTIIEQGASAKGTITNAKKAGSWGKTGKLEWAMLDVQTVSGTRIPVRFTKATAGGSKSGTVAIAAVATTVLLGPVGLLWGFKKGKKAEIAAGNKYTIFVDGNATIKSGGSRMGLN